MASVARNCGLDPRRVDDVKLAVSEAVTNAVRHAYRSQQAGDVTATAHVGGGLLRIVVADTGHGMVPRSDSPGLGLGLPLMAQAADTIAVIPADPGTEIHMTFACPAPLPE